MEQLHFLLGFLVCTTGLFVFLSLNPVHSVLFLILTFFNSSLILLLINAEFLALTFVIVYVGAIAVLFLFVVMMLNLKIIPKESSFSSNFLFFLMGIVFLIQFFLFLENRVNSWDFYSAKIFWESDFLFDDSSNLIALGDCLYNSYYILFLLAGLILLIALLGSINLTLNFTSLRTTEVSFRQLSRSSKFLAFFK